MKDTITLFHGSEHIIERPVYKVGNPKNDYGYAFYCTREIDLAYEWAVTEERNGYVNEYDVDLTGLSILNLGDGKYNILNWLAILLDNRTFKINSDIAKAGKEFLLEEYLPNYKEYDVIRGYRADDSYFMFANAFINNSLSLDKLHDVMMLESLGEQYAIRSSEAFEHIKYSNSYFASKDKYYPKKKIRDEDARSKYRNEYANITEGIFLVDLIRAKRRGQDVRIQPVIYK